MTDDKLYTSLSANTIMAILTNHVRIYFSSVVHVIVYLFEGRLWNAATRQNQFQWFASLDGATQIL